MNRFIESRIFHILCTLTDLVVLNLLYVLCCIPVVTIGAATTALYGTVLALLHDEGHLYTLFVRIFLKRFKQTTVFWLLWLTAVFLDDGTCGRNSGFFHASFAAMKPGVSESRLNFRMVLI